MPCRVVVGVQWGDEGKGKIVDYLCRDVDAVARCQGGANAGHTVVAGAQKIALHLVPSGVLHPRCEVFLASGMVIDPLALLDEIEALERAGIDVRRRLHCSPAAHLVLPHHRVQDGVEERRRGGGGIGTTGRGIGPAYADKAARTGLQFGVLRLPAARLRALLLEATERKLDVLRALDADLEFDAAAAVERVVAVAGQLAPLVGDTTHRLQALVDAGRHVLLEGAQGLLLDLDHGSYPYVTSSPCTSAGLASGAGLAPRDIGSVIGVAKAYATRVGNGPFPTEIQGAAGETLRQLGQEFGVTTGRPRRCGWFDAVAVRHAARLSGCSELALTKLDILDRFERFAVADAYVYRGEVLPHFPSDPEVLSACTPRLVDVDGWRAPTTACRHDADLPAAARRYVGLLEELVGVPVRLLSVGPERDSTLVRGASAGRHAPA